MLVPFGLILPRLATMSRIAIEASVGLSGIVVVYATKLLPIGHRAHSNRSWRAIAVIQS